MTRTVPALITIAAIAIGCYRPFVPFREMGVLGTQTAMAMIWMGFLTGGVCFSTLRKVIIPMHVVCLALILRHANWSIGLYETGAHLFVGFLFAAMLVFTDWRKLYGGLLVGITAVELVCSVLKV